MTAMDEKTRHLLRRGSNVPLRALNVGCRKKLSLYMDPEGGFIMEKDINNDWSGLAELAGFNSIQIRNLKCKPSPTMELLYLWGIEMEPLPTVTVLIEFLLRLERIDVLTDCSDAIERDIDRYEDHKRSMAEIRERNNQTYAQREPIAAPPPSSVEEVMTGEEIYYDAFVIYNPEALDQMNFVKEMADTLEGPQFNLKLFIPWRDDLPGDSKYTVTADIIEKKCRRAIVVLSHSFHGSASADFQLKFVQSLSPGARSKRVIPVQIEKCLVPAILNFVAPANFYVLGMRDWQWPRVVATIKSELNPSLETWACADIDTNDIQLDTSNPKHRQWWSTFISVMPLDDDSLPNSECRTSDHHGRATHDPRRLNIEKNLKQLNLNEAQLNGRECKGTPPKPTVQNRTCCMETDCKGARPKKIDPNKENRQNRDATEHDETDGRY